MDIKECLEGVRKNVSLAKYSTFRVGGKARYFFVARSKEDLIKAIKTANRLKMPYYILGGGSNVLFSDKGYDGLIIKIANSRFIILNARIYVDAGMLLCDLVKLAHKKSLRGLEWAVGIPGTVGGAIYGNAQAFSVRMSDLMINVEAIHKSTLRVKKFSKKQCKFDTKRSIFKSSDNLIILSAFLKLKKGDKKRISKKMREHLRYRKENHPLSFPSAGSIFVNTETMIKDQVLLSKSPELEEFNEKGVIPSGYLIEKCGLKGKVIGNAKISDKHANFIVNLGGAKQKDILKLINLAKEKVKKKFNIDLKEEIRIV